MKNINNISISKKISIYLFIIIIIIISLLGVFSGIFYYVRSNKWFYNESELSAEQAKEMINNHYRVITKRFVSIFGSKDFTKLMKSNHDNNLTKLTQANMQPYLESIVASDYIIDSSVCISKNNIISANLWTAKVLNSVPLSEDDKKNISGISLLSLRPSLNHTDITTIPIVYPLKINQNGFVNFSKSDSETYAYIIVYLNYNSLKDAVLSSKSHSGTGSYHEFYFYNKNGICLSQNDYDKLLTKNGYQKYEQLEIPNTYLLYHTVPASLMSVLGINTTTIVILFILVIMIMATISILLSRYITNPILILADMVKEIEQGIYLSKREFKTDDEIGRLNKAINRMYDTIRKQITDIKKEESEKYIAQMLRTSEQVNPHFLYNTLDAIQTEVRKGNTENAGNLIQYLSEYMRIGLSYGDDFIEIPQEIRHSNAYIHLMEQRFGKKITFIYQISPDLLCFKIPKTILQPLLENSIRHGFGIDADGMPIGQPMIEANFILQDDGLSIEISDNGSGFDTQKTAAIMYNGKDERQRHIGLHNVYYRLVTTYGKENVSVDFDSVPYYKNMIKITISLQE